MHRWWTEWEAGNFSKGSQFQNKFCGCLLNSFSFRYFQSHTPAIKSRRLLINTYSVAWPRRSRRHPVVYWQLPATLWNLAYDQEISTKAQSPLPKLYMLLLTLLFLCIFFPNGCIRIWLFSVHYRCFWKKNSHCHCLTNECSVFIYSSEWFSEWVRQIHLQQSEPTQVSCRGTWEI